MCCGASPPMPSDDAAAAVVAAAAAAAAAAATGFHSNIDGGLSRHPRVLVLLASTFVDRELSSRFLVSYGAAPPDGLGGACVGQVVSIGDEVARQPRARAPSLCPAACVILTIAALSSFKATICGNENAKTDVRLSAAVHNPTFTWTTHARNADPWYVQSSEQGSPGDVASSPRPHPCDKREPYRKCACPHRRRRRIETRRTRTGRHVGTHPPTRPLAWLSAPRLFIRSSASALCRARRLSSHARVPIHCCRRWFQNSHVSHDGGPCGPKIPGACSTRSLPLRPFLWPVCSVDCCTRILTRGATSYITPLSWSVLLLVTDDDAMTVPRRTVGEQAVGRTGRSVDLLLYFFLPGRPRSSEAGLAWLGVASLKNEPNDGTGHAGPVHRAVTTSTTTAITLCSTSDTSSSS
jgi:hypothetical protein